MALAAGVSPRLRPPGPHTTGRQGRSRGLSLGCARPDCTKEAAETEAGAAPGGPGEGDGSMVNGEGCGRRGQAATPLTPGDGRATGVGRGPLPDSGRDRRPLAGRSPAVVKLSVVRAQMDPERGGSGAGAPALGKNR